MRLGRLTLLLTLLALTSVATRGYAADGPHYLASSTLVTRYYNDFLSHHQRLENDTESFIAFCDLLADSDLIADRMAESGVKRSDFLATLEQVRELHHASLTDPNITPLLRQSILSLDLMLEHMEISVSDRQRDEFRREVTSDIPPMILVGAIDSTWAMSMLLN